MKQKIKDAKWLVAGIILGIVAVFAFTPLWQWHQPFDMFNHRDDSASMAQDAAEMSSAGSKNGDTVPQIVQKAFADGTTRTVIDVGYSQGYFDWDSAAGQIDGAILECGYGNDSYDQDDWTFDYNVAQCERLGIPYGIYLYSYASNADMANSEADHLLRQASKCNPTLGVVLDVEEGGLEYFYRNAASIVLDRVQSAGYKAIWYSGAYNATTTGLGSLPYAGWVADYDAPLDFDGSVSAWQYTNDGVMGVDTSYWYDGEFVVSDKPATQSDPTPVYSGSDVRYRVHISGVGWLSEMIGQTDTSGSGDWFAGIGGQPIDYIAVDMPGWYQVKTEASGWLPPVYAYNIDDLDNGCAGDGSNIIALRAYYETADPATTGWLSIDYSVSTIYSGFFSTMHDLTDTSGSGDDFAGNDNPIDCVTMYRSAA